MKDHEFESSLEKVSETLSEKQNLRKTQAGPERPLELNP
jgi:hypothetical protein